MKRREVWIAVVPRLCCHAHLNLTEEFEIMLVHSIASSCYHTTRSIPQKGIWKTILKRFWRQHHMEIILLGSFARLCRTLVLQHLVTTATEKENLINAWLISFLCQQLMKLVELSARVLDAVWSTHYITCWKERETLPSYLISSWIWFKLQIEMPKGKGHH